MAKRKNDDSGAHSRAEAGDEHSLYFDTSLNTHILLTVSDYDTVSDLTKKIVIEHLKCFPTFGPIKIHALKVKRRGYFYHLPESMLVGCAFEGVMKRWFLSVDASSLNSKNEKGLGTEFVSEEQPKEPATTGIDTSATANEKSIPFEVGATIGSKEMNHTINQQSRDQGILASPSFHDSSNAVKRGAEIGSEDKDPSDDKTKKRKLPTNNAISSQDASDGQNNEVIVKDSKNSTHDERPKKRSKKSVAANPNLSSMEDEIGKGKFVIAKVHNTGEKKDEKFDPSHQNDTNGYVKEATSSAEFLGINKGKESEKSNDGKKMNKSTKKDALSMEKDCTLENKTDEKIQQVPNEKDHEIMLSEEVGPKLQIEKTVTTFNSEANKVKEVENTTSEQRKKMKAKKSNKVAAVKPMTTSEKNVNPSSDVPATDLTYKSDDEAMLLERGDASFRNEAESFLANQVIEAPKENSKSMKSDPKNQLAGRVLKEAGFTHSNLKKKKKKKKKTESSRVCQPTDIVP